MRTSPFHTILSFVGMSKGKPAFLAVWYASIPIASIDGLALKGFLQGPCESAATHSGHSLQEPAMKPTAKR